MNLREARIDDAASIRAVHGESVRGLCADAYSPAQIEAWSGIRELGGYEKAIRERLVRVAEEDDRIVGFAELDVERGQVNAVYVEPGRVRQGVGSHLLDALESVALAHGLRALRLNSSLNAVPFYEARGFDILETGVHRLGDGTEVECVRMDKKLNPDAERRGPASPAGEQSREQGDRTLGRRDVPHERHGDGPGAVR